MRDGSHLHREIDTHGGAHQDDYRLAREVLEAGRFRIDAILGGIQVYELISEGMAASQHGQYEESVEMLTKALETEPKSVSVHYLLGLDYYRRYPGLVQAVTRDDIQQVAREFLSAENYVLANAGPE